MKRTFLFLTLAFSSFLLFSSNSHATFISSQSPIQTQYVKEWLTAGEEYWDIDLTRQCPTGIKVRTVISPEGGSQEGLAWDPLYGCEVIFLEKQYTFPSVHHNVSFAEWYIRQCYIFVHEYGHLIGHNHNKTIGSVMFEKFNAYDQKQLHIPACLKKYKLPPITIESNIYTEEAYPQEAEVDFILTNRQSKLKKAEICIKLSANLRFSVIDGLTNKKRKYCYTLNQWHKYSRYNQGFLVAKKPNTQNHKVTITIKSKSKIISQQNILLQ